MCPVSKFFEALLRPSLEEHLAPVNMFTMCPPSFARLVPIVHQEMGFWGTEVIQKSGLENHLFRLIKREVKSMVYIVW